MNTTTARPTRTAPPPTDSAIDATFNEVERPSLPATRPAEPEKPPATISARDDDADDSALPVTGFSKVISAIADVMAEIKPVEKEGFNKFHGYRYAKMQDLSRELTPLMGKHGIVVFQNEEGRELFDNGNVVAVRYRFTVVHRSGEVYPDRPRQTGMSTCRNTKNGFDDKTLSKCHTAARKYFLFSLFQIATSDEEDGDNGGGEQQQGGARPTGQTRRPVPSPTGKLQPHAIPIIQGEAPQDWAKRLLPMIAKAESPAEVDSWYSQNAGAFDKLKAGGFHDVHNDLIDAMDARSAAITDALPKEKPATPAATGDAGDIPANLRRAKPLPAEERDWLNGLGGSFTGCEDIQSLADEQARLMTPYESKVSIEAWNKARELLDEHVERVQAGEG